MEKTNQSEFSCQAEYRYYPWMTREHLHVYDVRPRNDRRGMDLISDVQPFGRLWYGEPNAIENSIGYAKHRSRSYDAVIRVYDESGNVIETHERAISRNCEAWLGSHSLFASARSV